MSLTNLSAVDALKDFPNVRATILLRIEWIFCVIGALLWVTWSG